MAFPATHSTKPMLVYENYLEKINPCALVSPSQIPVTLNKI